MDDWGKTVAVITFMLLLNRFGLTSLDLWKYHQPESFIYCETKPGNIQVMLLECIYNSCLPATG